MPLIVNSLMHYNLVNFIFKVKLLANYTIENII
jgi:hypothetical protein